MGQLGRDIAYPKNTQRGVKDVGAVAIAHGAVLAVVGASGPRLTVQMADADSAELRDTELLLALGGIEASGIGRAVEWLVLEDVDTSGATESDPVYLSGTTGGWTLTAPANALKIGVVLVVSATVGAVLLHPGKFAGAGGLTGGPFTDNRLLRAHGTTGVQDSLWTMDDQGVLTGPTADYNASIVWVAGLLELIVDRSSRSLVVRAGTGGLDLVSDGTGGQVYISADHVVFASGDNVETRASLGIGDPEYAANAATDQIDIAAGATLLTFTVLHDSAEVTYNAGEWIIVTAGLWLIEWSVEVVLDTNGSGEIWLTDDTALQGTDVETVGTRRKHRVNLDVTSSTGTCAAFALLDLAAGDTVRLMGQRVSGADLCEVQTRSIKLQRIG